jgi:hypothetical protein
VPAHLLLFLALRIEGHDPPVLVLGADGEDAQAVRGELRREDVVGALPLRALLLAEHEHDGAVVEAAVGARGVTEAGPERRRAVGR